MLTCVDLVVPEAPLQLSPLYEKKPGKIRNKRTRREIPEGRPPLTNQPPRFSKAVR